MNTSMDLKEKKQVLIRLIINTEKPALLAKVEAVLKKEKANDWWNQLSDTEKEELEKGIAEADSGQLIPYDQVMRELRAKYDLDE